MHGISNGVLKDKYDYYVVPAFVFVGISNGVLKVIGSAARRINASDRSISNGVLKVGHGLESRTGCAAIKMHL